MLSSPWKNPFSLIVIVIHRSTNVDGCREVYIESVGRWMVYSRVFQRSIDKCIDKHVKGKPSNWRRRARNLTTNDGRSGSHRYFGVSSFFFSFLALLKSESLLCAPVSIIFSQSRSIFFVHFEPCSIILLVFYVYVWIGTFHETRRIVIQNLVSVVKVIDLMYK
jgi:hypothetical protein